MKSFPNCPNIQYAIILASSTHDSPELFVLAYADENSLRSLIAEASIIAFGFVSRSAADAARSFHQTFASQHLHAMSARRNANAPMPKAYVECLAKQGLNVRIEYVRHAATA
jgi:hypothetical protein